MAVGDVDGDGLREVIWTPEGTIDLSRGLYVADWEREEVESGEE